MTAPALIAPAFVRFPHYYETDQMGVVHHSNYIRWFEEARVAFLRHFDIPYETLEQKGILIPVLGVNCEYLRPARFGDPVRIEVTLDGFESGRGVRFRVRYRLTHEKTRALLATGWTLHCFTDASLKIVRLKRDDPEAYEKFLGMEIWSRAQAS